MADLASMRAELRALRKEHVKPVSRMRKGDISSELENLRRMRETTPAAAATPSAPPKVLKSRVESVKEAKKSEFPVKPSELPKKAVAAPKPSGGKVKDVVAAKVKMSKAKMMELIQGMASDDE